MIVKKIEEKEIEDIKFLHAKNITLIALYCYDKTFLLESFTSFINFEKMLNELEIKYQTYGASVDFNLKTITGSHQNLLNFDISKEKFDKIFSIFYNYNFYRKIITKTLKNELIEDYFMKYEYWKKKFLDLNLKPGIYNYKNRRILVT